MAGRAIHPQPERTCIGCRNTAAKRDLLRVVRRPDGTVEVDPTGRAAGRGAYVHRSRECVERAGRTGALGRTLKVGLSSAQAASLIEGLRITIGETA
jgi:uncharacterized protein